MTSTPRLTFDDRPHSLIGPSSFADVELCPQRAMPGARTKRTSFFADEGTVAHAVFEACLTHPDLVPEAYIGYEITMSSDDAPVPIDAEMAAGVRMAVDWVRENLMPGYMAERRLEMPGSAMFGYVDVFGIDTEGMWVTADLKYGSEHVSASTPQLGFYILMGMAQNGIVIDAVPPHVVVAKAIIFQPRSYGEPIRVHSWTVGDLMGLRHRLARVEETLASGVAPYNPGANCRWCARAAACPALMLAASDAAALAVSFDPAAPIKGDHLNIAAGMVPVIKTWLTAVEDATKAYLKAGGQLEAAYMKPGRNIRHWSDPDEAEDLLRRYGVEPYEPPALLSPAKAEKALPKAAKEEVAALVTPVPGSPILTFGPRPQEQVAAFTQAALDNANLSMLAHRLLGPQTS